MFLNYLILLSVLCLFTHLSSRFRYLTPCPCVCSALLIVCPVLIIVICPVMIVVTCSSSPCVYSLCVPVVSLPVRLSFLRVSRVPAFSMSSKVLAITTLACIIDSVFAFSLPVSLPPQPSTWITTLDCLLDSVIASSLPVPLPLQTTTCVTTLDWINDDSRCPSLIGFVCLYLDCLTVYRT